SGPFILHRDGAIDSLPRAGELHADGFGDVEGRVRQNIELGMKIADMQFARGSRQGKYRHKQRQRKEVRAEKTTPKAPERTIAPARFATQDANRKHAANFRLWASR